ncbi:hypothetical protein KCG48_10585 [Proteiniclasticum sp. BAD-10]|uniref:Uncharacterized protein n=1 Tax=Proteiniclasticum sediminis TaxID=2804028 RepID=A0A941HQR1_9CLOT|nr:hypothetical protein [Proteiniclasticum sediminis]MBR0576779.1 hypothetical protein [Proteiniclasticum sediminis]
MDYKEYLEKYDHGFGHEGFNDGESMLDTLEELLEYLKDEDIKCPDFVSGGVPVKITIDPETEVEYIEERLVYNDFAGDDYEMTEEGKLFLIKCFKEYNEKYANFGYYCEAVSVKVPDEMKYQLLEEKK